MKKLSAGISGRRSLPKIPEVSELDLDSEWIVLIDHLTSGRRLRPVQFQAIAETGILDSRRNLVVSAPTNSGKSLVGYLLLFDAVSRGQRAILLEPLRALAQEKADELRAIIDSIPQGSIGHGAQVRLTTGDYRLEGETFSEPPPDDGEIIVATPERLQVILRGENVEEWTNQIGTAVVDEAHLVGSKHRGPTLEFVVAALLSTDSPPRIGLLSATIGSPEILSEWLEPCDTLLETQRFPQLEKYVVEIEEEDEVDEIITQEVIDALSETEATVLVFAYQRSACEKLCRRFSKEPGNSFSPDAFQTYHSGMSAAARRSVQESIMQGQVRCVVATTSLALGVNLPATLVIVRDVTFFGSGSLKIDELLQMMGRAGRGSRRGRSLVVVKPNDDWTAEELCQQLDQESLPKLTSSFAGEFTRSVQRSRGALNDSDFSKLAEVVAGFLARAGDKGMTLTNLRRVLSNTLAGESLADQVARAIEWLKAPEHSLAFEDEEGCLHLTVLGKKGMQSALPAEYTAAFGQLLRDLMSIDPKSRMLSQWSLLDHLILTQLLTDRTPVFRRFSERLVEQVDGWMESQPQPIKSMLFRNWISGDKERSKAIELLGSLGISTSTNNSRPESDKSRAKAYLATFSAILLFERASGQALPNLVSRWDIKSASALQGTEESWRDTTIWLVSGQGSLCEVRSFYHHLLSDCEADKDRILLSKKYLRMMRHQSRDLQEMLRYCSPLGALLRGVRTGRSKSTESTIGIGTIRKLESAGFRSIKDLVGKTTADLTEVGVQRRYAKQIVSYIRRRQR